MKHKFKLLLLFVLSVAIAAGAGCKKESNDDPPKPNPTPVKPEPKPEPEPENPFVDENVQIFDNVIIVKSKEITNVISDTAAQHYTITYSGETPEIKPGNVVVVRDGDEARVILVFNVKKDGNTVELDGPLGDLSYVFHDTEFYLATDPSVVEADGISVYGPEGTSLSKAGLTTRKDNAVTLTGSLTTADNGVGLKGELEAKIKFNDAITEKLKIKAGLSIVVHKAYRQMTIEECFHHLPNNYGQGSVQSLTFPKNEVEITEFYIQGDLDLTSTLSFTKTIKLEGSEKKNDNLIKEVVDKHTVFVVGEVPIPVNYGVDLYEHHDFTAELAAVGDIEFNCKLDGKKGFIQEYYPSTNEDGKRMLINEGGDPKVTWSLNGKGYIETKGEFAIYPLFWASIIDKRVIGLGVKVIDRASFTAGCGGKFGIEYDGNEEQFDYKQSFGWQFKADLGLSFQLGLYRKRFKGDGENVFYPCPFGWNNQDGFTYDSDGAEVKLFGINYEMPSTLVPLTIYSKSCQLNYKTDYTIDIEKPKKNVIDFPVHKDEPITILFNVFDRFYNDNKLLSTHFSEHVPSVIVLTSKSGLATTFFFKETNQKFVWTPESDDDYLEANIYDYKSKSIGYLKIVNTKASFVTIDAFPSVVYQHTKQSILGTSSENSVISVFVDDKLLQTIDANLLFSLDLPTDVLGKHTLDFYWEGEKQSFVYTVQENTLSIEQLDYEVLIGEEYFLMGTVGHKSIINIEIDGKKQQTTVDSHFSVKLPTDKLGQHNVIAYLEGQENDKKSFSYTVKRKIITITLDLPDELTVDQGASLVITGATSEECEIVVYVDNTIVQTIEDATVYSVVLPTDIVGEHNVKIAVGGQNGGEQTLSYTVEKVPEPTTATTTLPSVSGTELKSETVHTGGTAPDVKGQNIDQTSSTGTAPDVKGQNLDDSYSGQGTAPDAKGQKL